MRSNFLRRGGIWESWRSGEIFLPYDVSGEWWRGFGMKFDRQRVRFDVGRLTDDVLRFDLDETNLDKVKVKYATKAQHFHTMGDLTVSSLIK